VVLNPEEEAKPLARRAQPHLVSKFFPKLHKPDLLSAWTISHFIFSASMFLAPFVRSLRFATILVSICGIPWALTCWAPFAFMGVEINRLSHPSVYHAANGHSGGGYHRLSDVVPSSPTETSLELEPRTPDQPLHVHHGSVDGVHPTARSSSGPTSSTGELAGIYLGILNLFTTLPQFVGTFISMIVFSILEPGKSPELTDDKEEHHSTDGVNAIAACLFIGACSTIVAAEATRRLRFVS
jgi:solute carrier family 45 protein 1/2/4